MGVFTSLQQQHDDALQGRIWDALQLKANHHFVPPRRIKQAMLYSPKQFKSEFVPFGHASSW